MNTSKAIEELSEYSEEQLLEILINRIKKHNKLTKPKMRPIQLDDFLPVVELCVKYLDCMERDGYYDDEQIAWHYDITEMLMKILYGNNIYDWIKQQQ